GGKHGQRRQNNSQCHPALHHCGTITSRKSVWKELGKTARFPSTALIIVSAIMNELKFPQEPLRTLRLCAFARNSSTRSGFSQRRKGAKFAKILLRTAQFLSAGRNDDQGPLNPPSPCNAS